MQQKLKSSSSFRSIVINFSIIKLFYNIESNVPSHTSLINWVHKIGYYHLTEKKEFANDWVIILDHSIKLGQDKMFVIFGVRESSLDFTRPLQFQDLVPLRIESRKKWNGESISEYLNILEKEIGTIKYAVGDYGSDIKKGLRLSKINHIYDITHSIASILRKIYIKDENFLNLSKKMSTMRIQFQQSNIAHIIPPNQRSKSRYHNLKIISDWGKNALQLLVHLKENDDTIENADRIKEELKWVNKYQEFIEDLSNINEVICSIEKVVKTSGLNKKSVKISRKILSSLKTEKGKIVQNKVNEYFSEMLSLVKTKHSLLCTSDIIESAFGKYKNYLSNNPMAGITNLALSIAAFTSSLEPMVIKKAFEQTSIGIIKDWSEKFIGKTIFQKRRQTFAFT